MKGLNDDGIRTRVGKPWRVEGVLKVLKNYNYTGNLLLQKTYSENHLTKRKMINCGEQPQYHAEGAHEAIIDLATWEAVQEEMNRRAEHYAPSKQVPISYPFTGLIRCSVCGKKYRRKTTVSGVIWICTTYNTHGKKACASKAIPEPTLTALAEKNAHRGQITAVTVEQNNRLIFTFADGSECCEEWQDRSRSESWTEEMRAEVGRKTRERMKKDA